MKFMMNKKNSPNKNICIALSYAQKTKIKLCNIFISLNMIKYK
jgi:hypothetical protein